MRLSKADEQKLATKIKHIVGECNCPASSKTCAYWKNVDKDKPLWQTNLIIKEVNAILKQKTKQKPNKNRTKKGKK